MEATDSRRHTPCAARFLIFIRSDSIELIFQFTLLNGSQIKLHSSYCCCVYYAVVDQLSPQRARPVCTDSYLEFIWKTSVKQLKWDVW